MRRKSSDGVKRRGEKRRYQKGVSKVPYKLQTSLTPGGRIRENAEPHTATLSEIRKVIKWVTIRGGKWGQGGGSRMRGKEECSGFHERGEE